jgi:hypothetical protein
MRRLFTFAIVLATIACDHHPSGPQLTVDGNWDGLIPGYAMSMTLAQNDTIVTGGATMTGFGGRVDFDVNGTIISRQIRLDLTNPSFQAATYIGELSTVKAEISGTLDGSGFNKLVISFRKR